VINNLENFNISDELVFMLREMLIKDPMKRLSSYQLLTKYRQKLLNKSGNAGQIKYSPAKTISKIELTVDHSKNDVDPRTRKYSPEMNLSKREKIKYLYIL
jgi:hypothetical protein